MKIKSILLIISCLLVTSTTQAQFLKNLKKKAEAAAERTILKKTDEVVTKKTEKTIDDVVNPNDNSKKDSQETLENEITSGNPALDKNTDAKKGFYIEDVVIKMHENGKLNQTQYFDADAVAVKMEGVTLPKAGYTDSEGFIYGYNENAGEYQKSSLVSLQSQGMMVPTMMLEAYKLPPEPFMYNLEKQQNQGLTPNPFNGTVEFAFIYEPEQFRYEDFKESKQKVNGKTYTKFDFLNEPGYEGSYVLFDNQDRLVEIYTNKQDTGQMDMTQISMIPPGESLLQYEYKPVSVALPPAREVRAQGQGMMEMVMGSFGKSKKSKNSQEEEYDTQGSKGMVKSMKTSMKNHKVTADMLPDSYDFNWEYKTVMTMDSRKKDNMQMNFLINTNTNYQGSEFIDAKNKDMGKMVMVFDLDLNSMLMFMNGKGNQNMLQIFPIPEQKIGNGKITEEYNIIEIPSKTILGYNCKGLQMENNNYIVKVYHAKDAPVSLTNFFSIGGSKNMKIPEIDPRLVKQFSSGLIMEMQYIDKKKNKNNIIITGQSIHKKTTSIKKEDYKVMDLFMGGKMFGGN